MANNIKVLKPEVFNKISAGEVVETPAGALKELVENSIDAGATRIAIDVKGGGIDLISVSDNGCGIREEDVSLAFYKHATSKLTTSDELSAIETLGFRGEALSSISAVSKVKLTTRYVDTDAGISATIENGTVVGKQYVSANVGTKIEVRDLFYNMPARKKFLKSMRYESMSITKYVARLILTNPTLEVIYTLDGETVYQSNGAGLKEAIFAIYGSNCVENCISVDYNKGYYKIYGYIGAPEYAKANRNYQTLSVNGRLVEDTNVSAAIFQAYKPYLMTRKYPFFVLNIDMPCDMVDVNVHPKKTEVRFSDLKSVCGAFFRAVEGNLTMYKEARLNERIGVDVTRPTAQEVSEQFKIREQNSIKLGNLFDKFDFEVMNPDQTADVKEIEQATEAIDKEAEFLRFAEQMNSELSVEKMRKKMGFADDETQAVSQKRAKVQSQQQTAEQQIESMLPPLAKEDNVGEDLYSRTRILGAAFKTYLILEIDDKIILVDQHAAHERILFDRYLLAPRSMQPLMFPDVVHVKEDESIFIDENIDLIKQAGVEVEQFGPNTYRIKAVDTMLSGARMSEFVQYLLGSVDEFKIDDKSLRVEKIAQKACKAAVKAGYCLNEYEIKYILKEVFERGVMQCPHGRPVSIVYTKRQIEKAFKRIV